MKWPDQIPKNLWMLLDHDEHIIGFAFEDGGLTAIGRYPTIRRAVRYDRMTTDAQEQDRVASAALEQLELWRETA